MISHPLSCFKTCSGKYEQPYAEYNFTMDFQIIVQTAQGLRPSVPVGAQNNFVDLFHECVENDPLVRPSAQEAARTIRVCFITHYMLFLIIAVEVEECY